MRQPIEINELALQPFTIYGSQGAILVSGPEVGQANPMTISWGMFGIMWGKPVAMVMVRPTRYTWDFITKAPDFTINWLPDDMTDALGICGSASGRDMDKWDAASITAAPATAVGSPLIAESHLVLECRTLYRTDVTPEQFLDQSLLKLYNNDFHGLFFGEVVAAAGDGHFRVR